MQEIFLLEIFFLSDLLINILTKMALAGLILLITWVVSKILGGLVSKSVSRLGRQVAQQIRRALSWLVWFIGIVMCLGQIGLELTILLVIIALGGIALIIAFRDILLNMASREAIAIYNPFKIGDWIQVGEYFGRIIDINLISTVLVTPDNEIMHIPNSKIVNSTLINRTTTGEIRIHVPLTVDNTLDLSYIEDILIEVSNELKDDLAVDSKPEVRVVRMDNRSVQLELLLRINNPAKSKIIVSEILKRVKTRLKEIKKKISDKNQ
ncbi:MAG: mechanosensitive ion channel family protein [Crenarchaeota archaeon]|nr:mechanosensitive ion channel family protein [Thermoproteota archaeon]MDW8033781.1 mechanosensitive ion channel [Nitrososphaerota archaeon]